MERENMEGENVEGEDFGLSRFLKWDLLVFFV